MLNLDDYTTPIQVVEVLSRAFKYVNTKTGSLFNTGHTTYKFPLREIRLRKSSNDNVVFGERFS